jgi:hypothetical protein
VKNLIVLSLVLASAAANAQQTIDVAVRQVNDRRTSGFFAQLVMSLELPKLQSSEVAASRVFVTSAVDDTGASLVGDSAEEPQFEMNSRAMMPDAPPMPASVSLTLENPRRKAMKVKEVKGEIELYMPGKDPNSVAEIPKFITQAGKALSHKALEANGVEISMVSPAQLEAERRKKADAKKKEYEEMGFSGEDLANALKSFVESLMGFNSENDVYVRIKDPNKRIQEISYVDAAGEVKLVSRSEEDGMTTLSTWAGKPQPDWKMRVSMKTPKNVMRYAFALSDVPLP